MAKLRKTILWAAVSCFITVPSAIGQSTEWRPAAIPLDAPPNEVSRGALGVSLGRPTATGIQQASLATHAPRIIARGVGPMSAEDQKRLLLPDDVSPWPEPKPLAPLTQPAETLKAKPRIIATSNPVTVLSERIIILNDAGEPWTEKVRWLPQLGAGGNQQLYASAEWLQWTTRGMNVPPLVTTALPTDPGATLAVLGFGSTRTLFGPGSTLEGLRPGARFTVGYNIDPCGLCAIEGSFFFLSRKYESAVFDSNTTPVIGRPFVNINLGRPDAELTALLPDLRGNLRIDLSTSLHGAELNKRALLCCGCAYQITCLAGFRYLNLSDHLGIDENVTFLTNVPGPPAFSAGDSATVFDRFDTRNRFYGGQIGAGAEWRRSRWVFEGSIKVALGATQQIVDIDGGQQFKPINGGVQTFRGGLYALPTNIGQHSQTRLGVVPELGLKVGYQLTDNVRIFAGYDFLYWSSVLRAGDQIDPVLNAGQIPNSGNQPFSNQARPIVPFRTSSYWAHGLIGGLEIRY